MIYTINLNPKQLSIAELAVLQRIALLQRMLKESKISLKDYEEKTEICRKIISCFREAKIKN